MAGEWRRLAMVAALAVALVMADGGSSWASAPAAVPAVPTQVVVATIPAGPIVISVSTDERALLDLTKANGIRVLEGDRAQVIAGVRIVDTRAAGALPWVMTVQSVPGSITLTIG